MAPHRMIAPALVVAIAAVGCGPAAAGPTPTPTGEASPVPTAVVTGAPSSSPNRPPTPVPAPTGSPAPSYEATTITGALVLRVDSINPEMGPAFVIPLLSLYEDGTVIRVAEEPEANYGQGRFARLTTAGTEALLAAAGGASVLRTGTASGDRVAALESWLPASAWAISPGEARTWVPTDYILSVRASQQVLPRDRDIEQAWSLDEPFESFGDPVPGDDPDPPDLPLRCGVVTLDEALALQAASGSAGPGLPSDLWAILDLTWQREASVVSLALEALLPDEPRTCEAARFFP